MITVLLFYRGDQSLDTTLALWALLPKLPHSPTCWPEVWEALPSQYEY